MHCYMGIETFLTVNYNVISIRLYYHIGIFEIRMWFQVGHTQNVGMVAPRPFLVQILEITTVYNYGVIRYQFCTMTFLLFTFPLITKISLYSTVYGLLNNSKLD